MEDRCVVCGEEKVIGIDKATQRSQQRKNESELHYGGMAERKPDEKAMKRFKKPAYEVTDVIGYMAKKYDIKGEM